MKIHNFAELDNILKKSFKVIRKDLDQDKKTLNSKYDDLKKNTTYDKTMWDTKIKFLTNEIKKLKDSHSDLISLQKAQVDKLDKVNEKHLDTLKQHVSHELGKVEAETDRLKEDLVKLVGVLKEKMVTRKLFDDRNRVYEKSIGELLELTKDVKEFKMSYLSQMQLKKQIGSTKEEIDVLKEEIASVNEELSELRSTSQSLIAMRDELPSRFVDKNEFNQKLALFDRISASVDKIDSTVADLTTLKDQVNGAVKVEQELGSMKSQFETELSSLQRELISVNDSLNNLKDQQVDKDSMSVHKDNIDELNAKMSSVESSLNSLSSHHETLNKVDKMEQDVEEIRDELLALPDISKEIEKLKKENEQLLLKVDAQQLKLEMFEATSPTKKTVEVEKELHNEEIIIETQASEQIQEEQSGVFSKTLKGLTDFFIEDEEPIAVEQKPVEAIEPKAEKQGKQEFIKNIEKLFDEPESYQFDAEVHNEIEEAKKPGVFSRLKTGVVNFLFEEVNEIPDEVISPAQAQEEQSIKTEEYINIPINEEITTEIEESAKKIKAKPISVKKTIEKKAISKNIAKKKVPIKQEIKKKVIEKPKKEVPHKVEVYESDDEEGEGHYMTNKKPKVSEEGEDESDEMPSEDKKKKYKKIKNKDPFSEDVGEEEIFYPEDYFY